MYTIRDLTQLDYEPCLDLLQDPVYNRLFAYSSLEALHLECQYASVALKDDKVVALLLVGSKPQYYPDHEQEY